MFCVCKAKLTEISLRSGVNRQLFVPTIENGEELCIRCVLVFFLTKLGTTNNHRTGLSAISY